MIERSLQDILDSGRHYLSNIKPSEWTEKHRVLTKDVSAFPGKFSYDRTPYCREIVDRVSDLDPARVVAVKKGAQVGFSVGVIESAIGYIISQNPGNILFLTGHSDLSEEAILKVDQMIDSCGLRPLIKPNVLRAKNSRTGDTNKSKEFPGGSLVSGSASNHKLLRQRSVRYGFIDDFDAAVKSTKQSGSTTEMIEQRFAAYYHKMKLFYISTPELKQTSNIEPVYLLGDQRKYHIPCPCCGEYISLYWEKEIEGQKEKAGITYQLTETGKLIEGSVGYICQECGGFFTDSNKYELNLAGQWKPTAEPSQNGYYSYHISSLYAPPGMYDWEYYVRQYLEANPFEAPMKIAKMKTFTNLALGETWEELGEAPKANQLQRNIRPYEIGIIPEKLSIKDGNGKIMLLTCACDLNGTENDARLDWEIVAWSESGASYSVKHGSIGTFIPREGTKKTDRERWTYEHHKQNSVWTELEKILGAVYLTDTDRKMKIFVSGVDTGHYTQYAYDFIDRVNYSVMGLKGKDADKYIKYGADLPSFKPAKERNKLFLVEVNQLKDELAENMKLKWSENHDPVQPSGFMNYPQPSNGLYTYPGFFMHYESEHRIIENNDDGEGVSSRWVKKTSVSQNHFFDVRIYNMVLRDIMVSVVCKHLKMKNFGWADYVDILKKKPEIKYPFSIKIIGNIFLLLQQ